MAIWQDLVDDHGFPAGYASVRRFVSTLREQPTVEALASIPKATTGLRRGELTRLTVGDYDPPQRTLAIRQSKFHKSRLVPVSADTAREIEHLSTYVFPQRAE